MHNGLSRKHEEEASYQQNGHLNGISFHPDPSPSDILGSFDQGFRKSNGASPRDALTQKQYVHGEQQQNREQQDVAAQHPQPSHQQPEHLSASEYASDAEPSVVGSAPAEVQHDVHHDAVCDHLYNAGYLNGLFSDVTLGVPNLVGGGKAYHLHALVLARSPYLYRLLVESPTRNEISLDFNNDHITEDGLAIAIGHLYAGVSKSHIHPDNATAVLATAYLLQLPDLANLAADRIKRDICRETVERYIQFVNDESAYGDYSKSIQAQCFDFITRQLVRELAEGTPGSVPTPQASFPADLVDIFVGLPFHWLKSAIESPSLNGSSDMKKYQFARAVIAQRERIRQRRVGAGEIEAGGEESVVLSFDHAAPTGRNVTIVRKALKGSKRGGKPERSLWKAPV